MLKTLKKIKINQESSDFNIFTKKILKVIPFLVFFIFSFFIFLFCIDYKDKKISGGKNEFNSLWSFFY